MERYLNIFGKKYFKTSIILLSALAIVLGLSSVFNILKISEAVPRPETIQNQMHNLPADVSIGISPSSPSATFRVPILLYHYVEVVTDNKDIIRKSLDILPSTLESQIRTLITSGYSLLTAADLADVLDGKRMLPFHPVLMTFDDGYRDFYTDVFPIIKKYNVHVTAYIPPGLLNKVNYMFTNQLMEITGSGLVEIGAHTVHHVYLKGAYSDSKEKEITQSREMLEKLIGRPVVSFAYPYGAFDAETTTLVKNAGFRTSVSTLYGDSVSPANRFYLYRIRPGDRTGKELINFLEEPHNQPPPRQPPGKY
jgi:peptidoglycan/xylan/chitin deacetylase (PgdA/CDA1 family)